MSAAETLVQQVPAELRILPQWVAWRRVTRKGKPTKPPFCAATGGKAACNDPETWGTFEAVVAACADGGRHFDGPGFVLTKKAGYVVIDLDHCRDPKTGVIEQWAKDIINAIGSYTEISPSGTGVHIWCRGKLPAGGRKKGAIETYDTGRYMTITGQHLDRTSTAIHDRQSELQALHARVFGARATRQPQQSQPHADRQLDVDQHDAGDADQHDAGQRHVGDADAGVEAVEQPADGATPRANDISDNDLIAKALLSKNKQGRYKFKELWEGSWQDAGYKSASEASLALCRQLAFWTNKDSSRIDRLFRRSPLYSDKWERTDYRTRTISRAIDSTSQVYSPQPPKDVHREGEGGGGHPGHRSGPL